MSAKPRRQIRLWVLMSAIFTLIMSLTLLTIVLIYRVALARNYQRSLRTQLTSALALLERDDFSAESLDALDDQGIRAMVLDAVTGEILYRDSGRFPLPELQPEGPRDAERKGRADRNESAEKNENADRNGTINRNETEEMLDLVEERLGDGEGSFFLTDADQNEEDRKPGLKSKELFLCGRSGDRIFLLNLPVESTNAAVALATRYATVVSAAVWAVSLVAFYFLSKIITRPHRRMADTAAQIAELDFSRRCPAAVTRELDDLGQSINHMADSLEANVSALRDANAKLQVELAQRTRQQQITAELLANLSHDLKTPIAIISGYAEGLKEGVARTPEKQRAYYEMILRESEGMQAIVSRILALGRMESGETPIAPEDFDLTALMDEVLDSFQGELERLGLELTRVGYRPCVVHTDYGCARQSLLNYVQNAVYHINNGRRIEVRLEDRGETVRVQVRNSSAPIPEEKAPRLWDKLYRGDPARCRHNGEMGLGLSIVKGNMERLGHPYGFENDPDFPGVCFWLELPKTKAAGDGERPAAAEA